MTRDSHAAQTRPVRIASLSDVGRLRAVNEDSCGRFERPDGSHLVVVADGMGGHRGGATASREAVAAIASAFTESASTDSPAMLVAAIERANTRIFEMADADPELSGMGTTVVAFLLDAAGRGTLAHVGDSRGYRFRARRLEALTTDHSVVAEMQRRGILTPEQAAVHPRRNEILRSVGVLPEVEVETTPVELAAGDWILLCSDGLCGVVSDAEIDLVLANSHSPDEAAADLVRLANDSGGPDNVTVAILVVPDGEDARELEGAAARTARNPPHSTAPSDPSRAHAPLDSPSLASLGVRPGRAVAAALLVLGVAVVFAGACWLAGSP